MLADSGYEVADISRANNQSVSAPFTTSTQALTLGATTSGTISDGQEILYRLTLPAGADISINGTFGVYSEVDMFASYGAIPTTTTYDDSQAINSTIQGMFIPVHQAGDYYILIVGRSNAESSSFSLTPTTLPSFNIQSVSPSAGDGGDFTLTITGSGFNANTTASLTLNNNTYTAQTVTVLNTNTIAASFALPSGDGARCIRRERQQWPGYPDAF